MFLIVAGTPGHHGAKGYRGGNIHHEFQHNSNKSLLDLIQMENDLL